MSLVPPPPEIAFPLAQWIPGIWPYFVSAANRGLRESGASPTSWYRSPARNDAVGGSRESQHLLGLALDVVGGADTAGAFRRAGFVVIPEFDHIHAQVYPAGVLAGAGIFRALRQL